MNFKKTAFYKSLKFKKNFWQAVGIDVIYYAVLFGVIYFLMPLFTDVFTQLQRAMVLKESISQLGSQAAKEAFGPIQGAINTFIFQLIITVIILFISYTVCKYLVWTYLLKRKPSFNDLTEFALFSLGLTILFVLILLALNVLFPSELFSLIFLVVYVPLSRYVLVISHPLFIMRKRKRILSTLGKIHRFILPALIVYASFIVLFIAVPFIPAPLGTILFPLSMIVFFIWVKQYLSEVLKKLV